MSNLGKAKFIAAGVRYAIEKHVARAEKHPKGESRKQLGTMILWKISFSPPVISCLPIFPWSYTCIL